MRNHSAKPCTPPRGRVIYGSGRKLAQDWRLKLTVDEHPEDVTFADHGNSGKQNFGEGRLQFIAHAGQHLGNAPRQQARLVIIGT